MANSIGLGVQFTASASGMTKGLAQADRLLQNLGKQAAGAASLFDQFASGSAAAAAAQQQVATDVAFLTSAFKTGQLSAAEYAQELKNITSSAQSQAALFAEGAALAERTATAEEKRAAQLARLDQLLAAGAITQETYDRAVAEASGANEEAARAEQERAAAVARAAQITQQNISPQQKYDQVVEELNAHLAAGRISQDTYNSALGKAAKDFERATAAANKYDSAVEAAGDGGTLKFNELSGVLSALPGPIGNVAGRLSGLSSAGEGLARIFGGGAGLSGGLSAIGASVAGLVNPFTVGVAAVAAFGAGATAVARGLIELEDRVENLGNIADKLGVSFEFIQVLEESANRSGTSIDAVSAAFGRLQKSVLGIDEESKAAQKALAEIGVTSEQLAALSPEEQYRLIGDSLASIEDPAKRTATAVALFGKSGADLIPFFKNLGPAASDIERLGGSLSEIDRARIDDFGAGLDALSVASSRLGELLILPFAGLGEGIAQGSAEFLGGINAIVGPIGDVLEPILSGLGVAFEAVGVVIGGIGRLIGAVIAPVGDLAQVFGSVGEVVGGAFVDVIRFLVDAAVATTEWLVSFSPIAAISEGIAALGDTISRVVNVIGTALSSTIGYVGDTVSSWVEFFGLESAIESIGSVISSVFGTVSQTFTTIAGAIGGTVGRLLSIAENFLGIKREVEAPVTASVDFAEASLAATQFADEVGRAATASAEFGDAGFQAALSYQTALEQIAQLQADNTLSSEEAKRAAEQEKAAFDAKIATLGEEAAAQKKAAEEAKAAADEKIAAAERVAAAQVAADERLADAFIQQQGIGAQDEATQAAERLLAITRQIDEAETAIVEARAAGDAAAEQAATRRLAILDQAQASAQEDVQFGFTTADAERAIADVRAEIDDTFSFENFQIAPDAFSAAQQQLAELDQQLLDKEIDPQTYEQAADAIRAGFEDALETAGKIADLNEQYAEEYANIERERLDGLNTLGPTTIQANDLRTSEGASQFLRLATGQQDPALEQRRQQLQKLDEIRREINKIGGTVEIVGAA